MKNLTFSSTVLWLVMLTTPLVVGTSCSKEAPKSQTPDPEINLAITGRVGNDLYIYGASDDCASGSSYKDMMDCCDHTVSQNTCAIVRNYYTAARQTGLYYEVDWHDPDGSYAYSATGMIEEFLEDPNGDPTHLIMSF